MGKRKAAKRKPMQRVKQKLDKEFSCLFCNHEKSIVTKLDRDNKIGHLECKKCGVEYQTPISYLSESIDIYSDWVDACEAANKDVGRSNRGGGGGGGGGSGDGGSNARDGREVELDYDSDEDDDD